MPYSTSIGKGDPARQRRGRPAMTTAQNIIDRAAKLGISAKIWEKGDKLRIYAQTGRRDMSVYLELDGTRDEIHGAALKVFCNTQQHPNWVKAQVAKY